MPLFDLKSLSDLPDYKLSLSSEIQGSLILYLQGLFTLPVTPGIKMGCFQGYTLRSGFWVPEKEADLDYLGVFCLNKWWNVSHIVSILPLYALLPWLNTVLLSIFSLFEWYLTHIWCIFSHKVCKVMWYSLLWSYIDTYFIWILLLWNWTLAYKSGLYNLSTEP